MFRYLLVATATCALLSACGGDAAQTADTVAGDADTAGPTDTTPSCGGALGSAGCACHPDGTCDTGLACVASVCQVASEPTGLLLPAGARACEVLLSEAGGTVSAVRFAAAARGTFIREAPRVAITVVALADADFAPGTVEVLTTGPPPTVASATCVDSSGAAISGAKVVLQ